MLELSAILSSDAVTRNFTKFTAGTLFKGLSDTWSIGLPSLVSHDSHRLAGWAVPTVISFQAGLTRLHGVSLIPETSEEQQQLEAVYMRRLDQRIEEMAHQFEELRDRLGSNLDGSERLHDCGTAALVAPDLARRCAPKIFASEDKDGLVPLAELKPLEPGVFEFGELVLFAHPSMRRSLSRWNNFNAFLLRELVALTGEPEVKVRLRLDPDAVGLRSTVRTPIELQYWWGPKFTNDLTSIPTGITRHEADDAQRYFHGLSRTEFWWHSRDGQHTLEAEEVRDLPTLGSGQDRFGCRYVHSIVDEETSRIVHLDGAIRDYSEEEIIERMEHSIAEAGRHTRYTKGWRVDGNIPLERWKLIIHHHFRDNPLVAEYFDEGSQSPEQIDEGTSKEPAGNNQNPEEVYVPSESSRISKLVPPSFDPNDPVRLAISLHEAPSAPLDGTRVVQAFEALVGTSRGLKVIEADTLELEKLLRRADESILLPLDACLVAFEDRYQTFPLIRHDTPAAVEATIEAFRQLFTAWIKRNDDRVVAFSLGAIDGGREVRVSIAGPIEEVSGHLNRIQEFFGCTNEGEITKWVDDLARVLSVGRDDAARARDPIVERLLTSAATFRFDRSIIRPEQLDLSMSNVGPQYRLRIPVEDHELLGAIRSRKIVLALAWVIREATCTRCEESYLSCSCSKYVDDGVVQQIEDCEIAYAFWTDRPA